jgi:hypothetical protein
VIEAVLNALPKTTENAPMRKLLTAAIKRTKDPEFVSGSSESRRAKHAASKLVAELAELGKS